MCIYTLFIFLFLFTAQCALLSLKMAPNRQFCFSQDLPKHSLIRLEAVNDNSLFRVEITHRDTIIVNETTQQIFFRSLTTQNHGLYKFCMINLSARETTLRFQFLSGIRAKDFGSYADHGDSMAYLKEQAKTADLYIEEIRKQNQEGLEMIAQSGGIFTNESEELFFTLFFIAITIGLSFLQYQILQRHMRVRKYI